MTQASKHPPQLKQTIHLQALAVVVEVVAVEAACSVVLWVVETQVKLPLWLEIVILVVLRRRNQKVDSKHFKGKENH